MSSIADTLPILRRLPRPIKILLKIPYKCLRLVQLGIDYCLGLFLLSSLAISALVASPVILYLRQQWRDRCRGRPNLAVVLDFSFQGVRDRGLDHLDCFLYPNIEAVHVIAPYSDATGTLEYGSKIFVHSKVEPRIVLGLRAIGLPGVAKILLEALSLFHLIRFTLLNNIGLARAFQHNYSA
ncbi:MAG: hypothetical protein KDK78_03485, partial [Chlamydiia bacterium]|nr:hypothetical protein [Chlamydiia bacterium]